MTIARRRPVWIWVIAISYVVSGFFVLLSSVLVLSGVIPVSPSDQAAIAKAATPVDLILTALIAILNFGGAIALWLLRKPAWMFFSAAFILNVGQRIWHASSKAGLQVMLHTPTVAADAGMSGSVLVGTIVGIIVALSLQLAVSVYAWKLAKSELMH